MNITVGVDSSEGSAQALKWAVNEAELHNGEVTAVLCWGLLSQAHIDPNAGFQAGYSDHNADAALASILSQTLGEQADTVRQVTVNDLPARGILNASENADLIVVGSRGMGGLRGMLMGSVSRQVLQHADRPVAIIRSEDDDVPHTENPAMGTTGHPGVRPVVAVGVDGSKTGSLAVRWATNEAIKRQAQLRLIHGWEIPYVAAPHSVPVNINTAELAEAAENRLAAILEDIDTEGLSVAPEGVTARGGAARGILANTTDAELIVMGSRGLGGFSGMLLGSVSSHITLHATCPVIVVRPNGEQG